MERLTEKNKENTAYYYPTCFKKCDGFGYSSKCDKCNFADKICEKLGQLEDLEEQGKLLKLPCKIGDTIYVIPSETNYRLNVINRHEENNRVYEQTVGNIEICERGYLINTCDGMRSVLEEFYKITWFLTQKEAEAALKNYEQ